ncbi:hypothetical protein [Salisaeta icosahedral phage 1]|uniref:hypothetical protein n=1 Tax=Salisaeta icosahedral phage 1 TaxID=1183239 RepID=UPI00025EA914|nr:hypothetical protein A322_gp07 [Salisaeta icosahedral phage 1]AFJ21462.1 hypothetical protein [Salisaeta icosahedral phage 1]
MDAAETERERRYHQGKLIAFLDAAEEADKTPPHEWFDVGSTSQGAKDDDSLVLADAINRVAEQVRGSNACYAQITPDGQIIFHYEEHVDPRN